MLQSWDLSSWRRPYAPARPPTVPRDDLMRTRGSPWSTPSCSIVRCIIRSTMEHLEIVIFRCCFHDGNGVWMCLVILGEHRLLFIILVWPYITIITYLNICWCARMHAFSSSITSCTEVRIWVLLVLCQSLSQWNVNMSTCPVSPIFAMDDLWFPSSVMLENLELSRVLSMFLPATLCRADSFKFAILHTAAHSTTLPTDRPMITIIFACVCWLTVPTLFAPYPTWQNLCEASTGSNSHPVVIRCHQHLDWLPEMAEFLSMTPDRSIVARMSRPSITSWWDVLQIAAGLSSTATGLESCHLDAAACLRSLVWPMAGYHRISQEGIIKDE